LKIINREKLLNLEMWLRNREPKNHRVENVIEKRRNAGGRKKHADGFKGTKVFREAYALRSLLFE
jgi:hypothetical protein